jgi:hypothetical protein
MMAVVMSLIFVFVGRRGLLSSPLALLGLGALAVIVFRHITQLPSYDERAWTQPGNESQSGAVSPE